MELQIKNCPIELSLNILGKKWVIPILRDSLRGVKRFSDFLKSNPSLSTKVLSHRLVELEEYGFLEKNIVSTTPLRAEYELTEKGRDVHEIIVSLAFFGIKHYRSEIFEITNDNNSLSFEELKDFYLANV
jgi:DNA-binding HxlR family transcriptional regulator